MKKILEEVPLVKHLELKLNEFKITHDPLDKVIEGLQKVTDITNMATHPAATPAVTPAAAPAAGADSAPAASTTPATAGTTPTTDPAAAPTAETAVPPEEASLAKRTPPRKSLVLIHADNDDPKQLEGFMMQNPSIPLDMRLVHFENVDTVMD
jgi:hypothetical protein